MLMKTKDRCLTICHQTSEVIEIEAVTKNSEMLLETKQIIAGNCMHSAPTYRISHHPEML